MYPINNTAVGGGTENNIDFKSLTQTDFTFPLTLTYNTTGSEASAIFNDLAVKCGANGGTTSNLDINYRITVSLSTLL